MTMADRSFPATYCINENYPFCLQLTTLAFFKDPGFGFGGDSQKGFILVLNLYVAISNFKFDI